ncbi:uncharacterized protein LOC142177177 [Nicotiana tabacum]|uniref:Uncharacterized protein LOC142177177 n=1 Tax=Nicotiana tabacum TaxID=4097 RepID=A0AC58TX00_TOBAC
MEQLKITDNHRQWHEKLSFTLLGYRTTMRTSIGETPYMLVYGTEVVIPVGVEIPSLRVIQEAKLDDAEWIRVRQEQLLDTGEASPVYTGAVGFEEYSPARKKPKENSHQICKVLIWSTECCREEP